MISKNLVGNSLNSKSESSLVLGSLKIVPLEKEVGLPIQRLQDGRTATTTKRLIEVGYPHLRIGLFGRLDVFTVFVYNYTALK